MEVVKPKTIDESEKKATKVEDEKKTNKDDVTATTNGQDQDQNQITLIKGHLKIFQGLTQQAKANTNHTQSSPKSSSSAYVMKIKMGNYKNSIQRSENTKKMEHHQDQDQDHKKNTEETTTTTIHQNKMMMMKKKVWDCESTLYDSFELNSFNRQLDSAISSSARSMSMPHISSSSSSSSSSSIPPPTETASFTKKKQNKISRSFQNFIKSMFRHNNKQSKSNTLSSVKTSQGQGGVVDMDKYYVVFDKTGSLTTIPESGETTTEMGGVETNSLVKKTVSERFPPSRLAGISCS